MSGVQASVLAVLSCGQLFVVLVGCIDLSVGSLIGASERCDHAGLSLETGAFSPESTAGLLTGAGARGGVNGVVVCYLRVPPMIATLAMLYFAKGAALTISGGNAGRKAAEGIWHSWKGFGPWHTIPGDHCGTYVCHLLLCPFEGINGEEYLRHRGRRRDQSVGRDRGEAL